jgi:GH43 family beta-xylosidase
MDISRQDTRDARRSSRLVPDITRVHIRLTLRQWQIDGTVFTISDKLYLVYSGWPLGETSSDKVQELFIVSLSHPTQASSPPVLIASPTEPWEIWHDQTGEHRIAEGPQFVQRGGFTGIVYSACASWSAEYKLATLSLVDPSDPLNPSSWRKATKPILQKHPDRGPYGPGHASFLDDGTGRLWCVYHATDRIDEGWENRKARAVLVHEASAQSLDALDLGTYATVWVGGGQRQVWKKKLRGGVEKAVRKALDACRV